jgi:hypothetical protein
LSILSEQGLDQGQIAFPDPLQDEAVGSEEPKSAGHILFQPQGLDPGVELLAWQVLLKADEAVRPEVG